MVTANTFYHSTWNRCKTSKSNESVHFTQVQYSKVVPLHHRPSHTSRIHTVPLNSPAIPSLHDFFHRDSDHLVNFRLQYFQQITQGILPQYMETLKLRCLHTVVCDLYHIATMCNYWNINRENTQGNLPQYMDPARSHKSKQRGLDLSGS